MRGHALVLTLFGSRFRLDEQVLLTVTIIAVAGLVHAFSYTAAEGAHPTKRWAFCRSADALAVVALYLIVRVWV